MKSTIWFVVLCFVMILGFALTPSRSAPISAPPSSCEIKFSAWCIAEGAYKISRVLASDGVHDRVWTLSGRFEPASKLIILEPNGCNVGFSDEAVLLGAKKGVRWHDQQWDRIQVRLKKDGSCDLQILVPPPSNSPMEWAYSSGLPLIRTCTKDQCPARNLGDLKSQIRRWQ